jgi:lactoylglutathione lyase
VKLINVRLLISEFPAAVAFWRDLMKLSMTYSDETMGYAYFNTDSVGVELMSREAYAAALGETAHVATPASQQAVLVFQVDDVDAVYADLVARGARAVHGPESRPAWGARTAQIGAPDGYLVEIYSPLNASEAPTA